MRIYTGAAVSLVFFMGVAWFAGRFLNLEGPMFAVFFALMATLGLTASAFFVWMQSKHDARKAAKDEAAAGGGNGTGAGA